MDKNDLNSFVPPADWTERDQQIRDAIIQAAIRQKEQREQELKELKKIMNMNDGALI